MSAVLAEYHAKVQELAAALVHLRGAQLGALTWLGITIAAILLAAYLGLMRRSLPALDFVAPVPIACELGRRYRKHRAALLKTLRLKSFYERGVSRLDGSWRGGGRTGSEYEASAKHLQGMAVFGAGSLFELLCTCRTELGRSWLARYLLSTPSATEIQEPQETIAELSRRADLRERVALLGEASFQDSAGATFEDWLTAASFRSPRVLTPILWITSTVLAILLLLGFTSACNWTSLTLWVAALLMFHGWIGLWYRQRASDWLQLLLSLTNELTLLVESLRELHCEEFRSAKLCRIMERLRDERALPTLQRLRRLTFVLNERNKDHFYGFSRMLLVGTHVLMSLERWRREHGSALRGWLDAWGEFEALLALAGYTYEHAENAVPEILTQDAAYEGVEVWNPLLAADGCVRNDVTLNGETQFYVISGSNMSGKSTLIRSVGLNAVLAYAGAPVCAGGLRLSLFSVSASLSVVDSLMDGRSRFHAEMDRLREAVEMSAEGKPVLFLFDEILSGTNSRDRRAAAEAIVRTLVERGARGMVSTHDLALTEIAALEGLAGANAHMGSRSGADPMDCDYVLKPGVSNESNAIEIARLAGIRV